MRLITLIVLFYSISIQASALFESDEILDITLTADFTELTYNWSLYDGDGSKTLPIKIKVGDEEFTGEVKNSANSRLSCSLIPMKINLKKKKIVGTIFEGNDKFKLTTHCGKYYGNKVNNENLFREYRHYKRFYKYTPFHLKVRLLRVHYIDTNPKTELKDYANKPSLAFILESDESFEKRTGTTELKATQVTNGMEQNLYPGFKIDRRQYNKVAFYNSMIGNGDWNVNVRGGAFSAHNIKIFGKDKIAYVVPFDFNGSREIRNRNYAIYYSKKYLKD